MNYVITIPSKGRAGVVSTEKVLGLPCKIIVPEDEVEEYKKYHKDVTGCPVNGITRTRNWILDNIPADYVIQADDDISGLYCYEKLRKFEIKDPKEIDLLFKQLFVLIDDLGTNLWGFNLAGDKKFYREYSPFSLSSCIVANLCGIKKDHQRFDERLKVKEDYDFSLTSLYRFKKVLRYNKYSLVVEHLLNRGGCVDYRTQEVEDEALRILQKKWGKHIVKSAKTRTFLKVIPPIRGI